MKKIITITILLFSMALYAQGNLQFNRIVNFKSSNSYTVPFGKVLKIVSINALSSIIVNLPLTSCTNGWSGNSPYTYCNFFYNGFIYMKISNQNYTLNNNSNTGFWNHNQCSSCPPLAQTTVSSVNFNNLKLPIWLSSGEEVSVAQIDGLLISAIEFNIIP
jgi:hypothetical protein